MIEKDVSLIVNAEEKYNFEKIYYENKKEMYALAYDILNNVEDAEDAVSEAFFRISKSFKRKEDCSCKEIHSCVAIILKKTAWNLYKKKQNEIDCEVSVIDNESLYLNTLLDDDYIFLLESIKKLPQKSIDIINLYYVCGFSAKEVGKILGLAENTVRKRAERAKTALKKILDENNAQM